MSKMSIKMTYSTGNEWYLLVGITMLEPYQATNDLMGDIPHRMTNNLKGAASLQGKAKLRRPSVSRAREPEKKSDHPPRVIASQE